jgi:hypothetical protein
MPTAAIIAKQIFVDYSSTPILELSSRSKFVTAHQLLLTDCNRCGSDKPV